MARAVTIAASYPLLRRSTYGFDVRRAILLWWSGLRGAIGLALGLLVLDDTLFPVETREQVMFQVWGHFVQPIGGRESNLGVDDH